MIQQSVATQHDFDYTHQVGNFSACLMRLERVDDPFSGVALRFMAKRPLSQVAGDLSFFLTTEPEQRIYLETVLEPLGPVISFPFANDSILDTGTWQASPIDVCSAIAAMRRLDDNTEGFALLDRAYGASSGLIGVRNRWQRVWFKGGTLSDSLGLRVLTLGWLLESNDRGAFVVVVMASSGAGGPRIDQDAVSSTASRFLSIVDEDY